MNILLVDSNVERRNNLKRIILEQGYSCDGYTQVTGKDEIDEDSIWKDIKEECRDVINKRKYSALLIHHNSNQNPFWDEFTKLCCETENMWCVSYSGGERANRVHERHYPFAGNVSAKGVANWDLKEFLKSVEEGESDPFKALTRFDPIIEAKLELLHICLTPPGETQREKIKQLKAEIEKGRSTALDSILIKADWTKDGDVEENFEGYFDKAVEELAKEKDCFSPKYIAILTALRDELLTD